jgi:hypothetical protein
MKSNGDHDACMFAGAEGSSVARAAIAMFATDVGRAAMLGYCYLVAIPHH